MANSGTVRAPAVPGSAALAVREVPLVFPCRGETLVGMVHLPEQPRARGVVIVVGGPQYRVGSHRQFVLLARYLAAAGTPVFRFDYRGMGDSSGEFVGFEECGPDIRAAVDRFLAEVPGLEEVVLWGLCDAASAICFHAHTDPRVSGAVLLNPWARTEAGLARARLRTYYVRRLASPEFWRRLVSGRVGVRRALAELGRNTARALGRSSGSGPASGPRDSGSGPGRVPLPERMAEGLERFRGEVLLILSGDDITAAEFMQAARGSRRWRRMLASARVSLQELPEANHTFSRREWRDRVARWTQEWVARR